MFVSTRLLGRGQLAAVQIVAATRDAGKREEFAILLKEVGWEAVFSADVPEAEQNASTFIGNAASKAATAAKHSGKLCIADDTGLIISDLPNGGPGIRASKMAEKYGGWREAMEAIVRDAGLLDDKNALVKAHFVCGMSVSHPDGSTWSREVTVDGRLRWPPIGTGQGFVPIFSPYEPMWIKGVLGHRRGAFEKLWPAVTKALKG